MKKLIYPIIFAILFFLSIGCSLNPYDPSFVNLGMIGGGINITVDVDASGKLDKYSVISASISITDPLGTNQFTNWTVTGTNHKFNFKSSVPGVYYMCLTDHDSLGDTNIFYTNVSFTAGRNYKLMVRLGAGLKQYGIYSESVPMGVTWGANIALDSWDGTTAISEDTSTAGEGSKSYKYVGGAAGWMGLSYRVNPLSNYKDMHSYREGSLRFMFKGTKPVRVGIQDSTGLQRWVYGSTIGNFGLLTNDNWCNVVIPFTNFATNIDFNNIASYFIVIGETGFYNGLIYHVDNIYWCNKTN